MSPLLWLGGALVAGVAAYLVGSPALSAARTRGARDLNEERYLAWRGRAAKPSESTPGMTVSERRRLWVAAGMAALAAACLVAFFVAS